MSYKYALLLFDCDGTTAVVHRRQLPENAAIGQQFELKESGNHLCEIVNLAETKDALNAWERTWSSSARSQLIDRKREKGASNGYLEQQNLQPIVLVDHIAGEVEQSVKRKRTSSVNQHVKKRNTAEKGQTKKGTSASKAASTPKTKATKAASTPKATSTIVTAQKGQTKQGTSAPKAASTPKTREPKAASTPKATSTIEGSNGRQINVLLQSSLHNGPGAVPMRIPNYVEHLNSDQRDVLQDILQNDKEHKSTMTEPAMTFVTCEQIANFVCVNTVNKKLDVFTQKIDKLEQLILSLSKSVSKVVNQNELIGKGESDICVNVYDSQGTDDVQASDDTFELDCSSLDVGFVGADSYSSVSAEGSFDVGFVGADSFSSVSVDGQGSRDLNVGLVGGDQSDVHNSEQDGEMVCIGRSRVIHSGRAAGIVGGSQSGVVDSGRAAGIVSGGQSGVDSGRAAGIVVGGSQYGVDSGRAAGIVGGSHYGVDSVRAAGIVGGGQYGVDSGRAAGIVGGGRSVIVDDGRAVGMVGGGQFGVVDSARAAEIVGRSGFVDGRGDMEIVGGVRFTSGGSQGSCVSGGIGVPNYSSSNFDRTPLSVNRSFGNRPLMIIRCADDMGAVPPHAEIVLHKDVVDELLLEHKGSISKLSWSLAKQMFSEEDLYSGTFNGKGGRKVLSPRRKQLILKVVGYAFPGITGISGYVAAAINNGIRNRRNYKKKLPY
ncbi:keratin, type I cytoskeletal 9-like isoform X2 [Dreissena polymorpha]|uniref:keratin, type I cytoskeletal 9-like isoform X2 n=1 Tax=Dreissena polymorpha TaxID=45954 RepID=UPI002263DCF8|nr:keratin, type I cytoskeletal 9-like isoform X2 [Dreissena polymorpha]